MLVCLFLCASTIFIYGLFTIILSPLSFHFVYAWQLSERVTAETVAALAQFTQCKATHIKNLLRSRVIHSEPQTNENNG